MAERVVGRSCNTDTTSQALVVDRLSGYVGIQSNLAGFINVSTFVVTSILSGVSIAAVQHTHEGTVAERIVRRACDSGTDSQALIFVRFPGGVGVSSTLIEFDITTFSVTSIVGGVSIVAAVRHIHAGTTRVVANIAYIARSNLIALYVFGVISQLRRLLVITAMTITTSDGTKSTQLLHSAIREMQS